jgi:hypothetical protein
MRSILFAAVLSLAACAASSTTNRPINVHSVRVEIRSAIRGDREIVSMGKVTTESAEVFTQRAGQPRRQEMWIKASGSWKLQETHDLAAAQ